MLSFALWDLEKKMKQKNAYFLTTWAVCIEWPTVRHRVFSDSRFVSPNAQVYLYKYRFRDRWIALALFNFSKSSQSHENVTVFVFFFFQSYYFNFLWRSWEENIAMTSEFLVLATIHIVNTRYVFNSRGYDFANTQLRTRKQLFCLIQRFSLTSRVMKLNSTRCGESFVAWKKNRLVESRKMETEFLFLPFKVEQSATGYKIATARTEFEYNFTETPTTELLCFKSSKHPSQVYI